MKERTLFVSFWHLCLDNLPNGNFRHRVVSPEDARQYVAEARQAERLIGVSNDDLIAPYRKQELEKHRDLCRVLENHFSIALSMEDFCTQSGEGKDVMYHVWPLILARIEADTRLLIVTCNYALDKPPTQEEGINFTIAPDSVTFHLIESA